MPDIFTKNKRSAVMSLIRDTGNKATELRLIQVFRVNGITGWRRGSSLALAPRISKHQVAGSRTQSARPRNQQPATANPDRIPRVRPDFVFPKLKTAVFVDGCFWHGCPKHATWPKTRAAFWRNKIEGNQARDRRVNRELRRLGWKVIRIWEHELRRRDEPKLIRRLNRLLASLD